jgi:hypothetical protein
MRNCKKKTNIKNLSPKKLSTIAVHTCYMSFSRSKRLVHCIYKMTGVFPKTGKFGQLYIVLTLKCSLRFPNLFLLNFYSLLYQFLFVLFQFYFLHHKNHIFPFFILVWLKDFCFHLCKIDITQNI